MSEQIGRVIVYLPVEGISIYDLSQMMQWSSLQIEEALYNVFEIECHYIEEGDHWTASAYREVAYRLEWIRYQREAGITTIETDRVVR